MKIMVEYIKDIQKDKIGKYNTIEELQFKRNHLNEEQQAEDRLVQDPGKYEGTSPKHSLCNSFKEIFL